MTIAKAIADGDVNAAFRYLALQERDEWSERVHVAHTGAQGGPIQTELIIRRVDAAGAPIPDSAIDCESLDDDDENSA